MFALETILCFSFSTTGKLWGWRMGSFFVPSNLTGWPQRIWGLLGLREQSQKWCSFRTCLQFALTIPDIFTLRNFTLGFGSPNLFKRVFRNTHGELITKNTDLSPCVLFEGFVRQHSRMVVGQMPQARAVFRWSQYHTPFQVTFEVVL